MVLNCSYLNLVSVCPLDTLIHVGVMQASNSIRIEKLVCLSVCREILIEIRTQPIYEAVTG